MDSRGLYKSYTSSPFHFVLIKKDLYKAKEIINKLDKAGICKKNVTPKRECAIIPMEKDSKGVFTKYGIGTEYSYTDDNGRIHTSTSSPFHFVFTKKNLSKGKRYVDKFVRAGVCKKSTTQKYGCRIVPAETNSRGVLTKYGIATTDYAGESLSYTATPFHFTFPRSHLSKGKKFLKELVKGGVCKKSATPKCRIIPIKSNKGVSTKYAIATEFNRVDLYGEVRTHFSKPYHYILDKKQLSKKDHFFRKLSRAGICQKSNHASIIEAEDSSHVFQGYHGKKRRAKKNKLRKGQDSWPKLAE